MLDQPQTNSKLFDVTTKSTTKSTKSTVDYRGIDSIIPQNSPFEILDYLDRLTSDGGSETGNTRSFQCPVCGSSNFKVEISGRNAGKYSSYGCDCMSTAAGKQAVIDAINPRFKKQVRSVSKQEFIYNGSNGDPIARVTRKDDGKGKRKFYQSHYSGGRWVSEMPDEFKSTIPLYQIYSHINREAIANSKPILIVEGEGIADRLISMGIPATTSIGGGGKWDRYGQNYRAELEGAVIVICPDRDEPGIKHSEQIAADFPEAQWLYADPKSFEWDAVPKDKGFDLGDWIGQGATREQILGAIGPKRVARAPRENKVVSIRNGEPIVPIETLDVEIEKLLDRNLSASQLQTAKIRLRQSSSLTEREFNDLCKVVEQSYEQGTESDPEEIRRLLRSKQATLSLSQIVHPVFAKALSQQAQMMNLREEVYLTTLLTTVGSLARNETRLLLSRATDYEVTPNLYSAIVAPPSQKKSPVISSIVTKPLRVLKQQEKERWIKAVEGWEYRRQDAQNKGEDFHEKQPQQEVFYFTKASGESILAQADRVPHRGLLNLADELAGTFKSKNQYRGGRGSDGEDMLSFYDGIGGTTLRVDGVRNDVGYLNYGVLGGIQPGVLKGFLGSCEDNNGNWARYIFVNQPIAASTLPDDNVDVRSVSEMLAVYYKGVADFEPQQYVLSRDAHKKFKQLYDDYEQRRVNEPNPALQAALGKSAGRVGKVALNLHLIEATANYVARPELEVSAATIEKAAMVAEFAIEQLRALYGDCDTEAGSSPLMARIIELSQRKGEISARDVVQALPKTDRPNSSQIRKMFTDLEAQGFGSIAGEGRSLKFTAFNEQVDPVETQQQQEVTAAQVEPEIETGDYVALVNDSYVSEGLSQGEKLQVIKIEMSQEHQMKFATVMKPEGSITTLVWLTHLQRSRSADLQAS
jgi:hypothetical protein